MYIYWQGRPFNFWFVDNLALLSNEVEGVMVDLKTEPVEVGLTVNVSKKNVIIKITRIRCFQLADEVVNTYIHLSLNYTE